MATIRHTFPARLANLAFALDAPQGFEPLDIPAEDVDFNDPTLSAPLAVLSSQVALALVTVAARPAYEDGSVTDWLTFLSGHYGITLSNLTLGEVGGSTNRHPAVLAEGQQTQEGTNLQLRLVMFEDGGRLVTIHAMCPDELAPSYLPAMQQCIRSFELDSDSVMGPTAPLSHHAPAE